MTSSEVIDLISDGEDNFEPNEPEAFKAEVARSAAKDVNMGNAVSFQNLKKGSDEQNDNQPELSKSRLSTNPGNLQRTSISTTCRDPVVEDSLAEPQDIVRHQLCREFWKAGDYDFGSSKKTDQYGMDHLRVHPKFLHSNATSHKWALGAIAELLDNAVDEIPNGATFVRIDKIINPRDNSPAFLVQDDGGGMNPDCMRKCMSLGYSQKTSKQTIGQYGNGFKTSTMRLGADVIVFSRCNNSSVKTQSVGLLSYTFLRETGHMDIVVPMVDFQITASGEFKRLLRSSMEDWSHNFSILLQWCPYSTETELLKQFDDIGPHGTKVIVYNLWLNDEGQMELDFDTDEKDIKLRGGPQPNPSDGKLKQLHDQHLSNRLRYSLRAYASILYLKLPVTFSIILRGEVVEHHSVCFDLKFPEYILYKPQIGLMKEVSVITTIGFTKEAPDINVHGFCVYHKNRLIIPFWKVFHESSSRGRGVVGVLEANFIEPAHDKQDFERTIVLQKLETRLKQMTVEYWNLHCHLIGYQPNNVKSNKSRTTSNNSVVSSGSLAPTLPSSYVGQSHDAVRRASEMIVQAFPVMGNPPFVQVSSQVPSAAQPLRTTQGEERTSSLQGFNLDFITSGIDTKPVISTPAVVQQLPRTNSIPSNSTGGVNHNMSRTGLVSVPLSNTRDEECLGMLNPSVYSVSRYDARNNVSSSQQNVSAHEAINENAIFTNDQNPCEIQNGALHSGNRVERPEINVRNMSFPDGNGNSSNVKRWHSDKNAVDTDGEASSNSSLYPTKQQPHSQCIVNDGLSQSTSLIKELADLEEANKRLKNEDHELETREKEIEKMIADITSELRAVERDYARLLAQSVSLGLVKEEIK